MRIVGGRWRGRRWRARNRMRSGRPRTACARPSSTSCRTPMTTRSRARGARPVRRHRRWASKPCREAPPSRFRRRRGARRAALSARTSKRSVPAARHACFAATHPHGPGRAERAVLAGVLRPALRQRPRPQGPRAPAPKAAGSRPDALVVVEEAKASSVVPPEGFYRNRAAGYGETQGGVRPVCGGMLKPWPVARFQNAARTAARYRRASARHRSAGRGCIGRRAGVASISRRSAFISSGFSRRPARTEPWQDMREGRRRGALRRAGPAAPHSASASATSCTSALMRPPARAAGTSRTRIAPGPKLSTTRPSAARVGGLGEHPVGVDGIEIDHLRDQQNLAPDAADAARSRFRRS